MPRDRISLYVESRGPDTERLSEAFTWFLRVITNLGGGVLAVPGKGNLAGSVTEVIGQQAVKALQKDNRLTAGSGEIRLLTERIKVRDTAGTALVVYPTQKLLDQVDSMRSLSQVLVVPWTMEEVEDWITAWGARPLGAPEEQGQKTFSNPTVRAALEVLSDRVNLGTGLGHPLDRAAAVEMFELLRSAGEKFDPTEIRGWLITELGWSPRHAADVAEVAGKVQKGRSPRIHGRGRWAADAVGRWKDRGREAEGNVP